MARKQHSTWTTITFAPDETKRTPLLQRERGPDFPDAASHKPRLVSPGLGATDTE